MNRRVNRQLIRKLVVGLLAATTSGILCIGLGGRIAMHIIGRLADKLEGFSFAGSMDVVLFGALIGAPAGIVFVLLWNRMGAWKFLRGLTAGFLTYAVTIVAIPSRFTELAMAFDQLLIPVIMIFGACFLFFGIVVEHNVARSLAFISGDVSDKN